MRYLNEIHKCVGFTYLVSLSDVTCCLEMVAEIFSPLDNPTTNPVRTTTPSVETVTARSVGRHNIAI